MVSMEAVSAMMAEFQRMNAENMSAILTKMLENKNNHHGGLTDSRGIGKPTTFKGEENKYTEWKAKLLAYLRVNNREADNWLKWASECTSEITEEDLDLNFSTKKEEVTKFAVNLYSVLMHCTEDGAFRICHSVKEGNGLEAIRLLVKRYVPKTPGTKRALLKAIINQNPAKKPEELEKNLMHLEELIKKYEQMGGAELPEDLRVALIIDMCHKDLKEHLELTTKDMSYKEVRDEIVNYAERKRNAFGNDLKTMEVDEVDAEYTWWGGQWDEEWESEELYSVGWQTKGKGKGYDRYGKGYDQYGKGNYKGSGKGYGKDQDYKGGYKGFGKNDYKGSKGYGKDGGHKGDGKGKGGGFQGHCHWCGEWGHSASRCKDKDVYMDGVRARNGKGGCKNMETDNVEGKNINQELESLEAKGGYRTLCNVELKKPVVVQNRFKGLETEEYSEEDYANFKAPPGLQGWTPVVRKSMNKVKKEAARNRDQMQLNSKQPDAKEHLGELDSLELSTVHYEKGDQELTLTIDSGASENVIGNGMAPGVPVVESEGSKAGVMYVTANGNTMQNKGEQHIHVTTQEGHKCMLNMQVTDVKKPLMSVARICDAGHEVTFTANGGTIRHSKTGQLTTFERVDNVYRLKVGLAPGFARPGI